VQSGELVRTLEGHTTDVNSVSFSPDGQSIVSGSANKTIRVWLVESGESSGSADSSVNNTKSPLEILVEQAMSSESPAVPWCRSKLMIVGEGAQGKSATLDSLLGRPFETGKASTVGAATEEEFCENCTDVQEWKLVNLSNSKEAAKSLGGLAATGQSNKQSGRDASQAIRQQQEALNAQRSSSDPKKLSSSATTTTATISAPTASNKQANDNTGETKDDDNINSNRRFVSGRADQWEDYDSSPMTADESAQFLEDVKLAAANHQSDESTVTFSAWDFGGQKVFYALHHAFLTRYGCYLVVFRMTNLLGDSCDDAVQQESMGFITGWLRTIAMHADRAPVALVGTHKDQLSNGIDHKKISDRLQSMMDTIKADLDLQILPNRANQLCFFPIDNTVGGEDATLKNLKEVIDRAVRKDCPGGSSYVDQELPLPWLRLHDKLRGLKAEILKYDDVRNIAETACGIPPSDLPLALKLLHQLGVLLFYDEPALRHHVILQPQWLITYFTRVVREWKGSYHKHPDFDQICSLHRDAFERFLDIGVVSDDLVRLMIGGDRPELVLRLMDKFALLCTYNDAEYPNVSVYLVPSCLPMELSLSRGHDDLSFASDNNARFAVTVQGYFPDGLWERVVCRAVGHHAILGHRMVPKLAKRQAKMSFGPHRFSMELRQSENRIVVGVDPGQTSAAAAEIIQTIHDISQVVGEEFFKLNNKKLQTYLLHGEHEVLYVDMLKQLTQDQSFVFSLQGEKLNVSELAALWQPAVMSSEGETKSTVGSITTLLSRIPEGMNHHFFISHYQATGGDVAKSLHYEMKDRGVSSWYDNNEDNLTQQGMEEGVKNSACFLLLLTSGVLTRPWVLKEFRWALQYSKPILLVMEQDQRMVGFWDFSQTSKWTDTKGVAGQAGKEYEPPQEFAVLFDQNVPVPDFCCANFRDCLPLQRRKYLVDGMVFELRRRAGIEAPSVVASEATSPTRVTQVQTAQQHQHQHQQQHGSPVVTETGDEVRTFLNKLNLSQYYDLFIEEGADDIDGIKLLEDDDLLAMGMSKKIHRRKVLTASKILGIQPSPPPGRPKDRPGTGRAGQNV
jgi:GTPase SAR1 family protein